MRVVTGLRACACALAAVQHIHAFTPSHTMTTTRCRAHSAHRAPWHRHRAPGAGSDTRVVSSATREGSTGLAKKDKRGFPTGDPRAKGGDENDVGLQVGPPLWKWPSQWPYPEEFFTNAEGRNTTQSRREYIEANIETSKESVIR